MDTNETKGMPVDEAIDLADEWARHLTPHVQDGWRVACKVLADEVRRLRDDQASTTEMPRDEAVRKAWARFSNAVFCDEEAPYPGMIEAFETHFSQSFAAKDWRIESGTWAAAWKAAKRHAEHEQAAPRTGDRDAMLNGMVARFLCWKLPPDFAPDCRIHFDRDAAAADVGGWPRGTNLLHAGQALEMFKHCFPSEQATPSVPEDVVRDAMRYRFLRAAKNIPISAEAARDPVVYDAAIDREMAAAPKPEGE